MSILPIDCVAGSYYENNRAKRGGAVERASNGSEHQNVDERLEVAFRNADVVAWKNQNRGVKGVDLFHAGT